MTTEKKRHVVAPGAPGGDVVIELTDEMVDAIQELRPLDRTDAEDIARAVLALVGRDFIPRCPEALTPTLRCEHAAGPDHPDEHTARTSPTARVTWAPTPPQEIDSPDEWTATEAEEIA